jgi:hypothetical protein
MKRNAVISVATTIVAASLGGGCGEANTDAVERGEAAVELCRGHGGVAALEDDVAICRDRSVQGAGSSEAAEENAQKAAERCRAKGGVAALDDDLVICRDQPVHAGEP